MLLLVVDTSTAAVTAAVIELIDDDPRLLAVRAPHDARGHGELLAPSIAAALDEASADIGDIGALVAGLGPGPFTGLRVGLVTAAVIADVRAVPVYGVCSLDGIGGALPDAENLLVATDARRREVYWARYERGQRVDGPGVARPAELDLAGVTALAGPGAQLYAEVWPDLPRHELFPDPGALVSAARGRIAGGAPSDPLTPLYLRRPDATVPAAPKRVSQVTETQ